MTASERFKSLYQKYYRRVVRFLVRAFHLSEEDAEDLAQESFLRFFEAMDEYRGEAEWAFLETIARRVAFNKIRSLRSFKRSAMTVDIDDPNNGVEPAAPAAPDYADQQEAVMHRKLLSSAIAALPDGQRQCMQLWLDDFTYDQIAMILRVSMDSVKSRLRDAKKALRARLGDEDSLPEDES
jgi:RNA polymerase sigma-70 factor (ECF subfamily)